MGIRRLIAASAAVVAVAGVIAAPASAYEGDWIINGQFARTTAPSFTPGFNPNDVDTVLVQFDNRRKTLSVRLDFFEAPTSGGYFSVYLGRLNGTECSESMGVEIVSEPLYIGGTYPAEERLWIPDSLEVIHTAVGVTPTGIGWRFDGLDAVGYRWIRLVPGHYDNNVVARPATILDPDNHVRSGTLTVQGIDGMLNQRMSVGNTDTTWTFTFAHVLLSDLTANCAEIYIPGRRSPLTLLNGLVIPSEVGDVAPAIAPTIAKATTAKVVKKTVVKKKKTKPKRPKRNTAKK